MERLENTSVAGFGLLEADVAGDNGCCIHYSVCCYTVYVANPQLG